MLCRYKNVLISGTGKDTILQWADISTGTAVTHDLSARLHIEHPYSPCPLSCIILDSKSSKKPSVSSLRLSDVTMLLKGKHSQVFKRKVADSAPDFLCFSVVRVSISPSCTSPAVVFCAQAPAAHLLAISNQVTKKRTLDLQAASANQVIGTMAVVFLSATSPNVLPVPSYACPICV